MTIVSTTFAVAVVILSVYVNVEATSSSIGIDASILAEINSSIILSVSQALPMSSTAVIQTFEVTYPISPTSSLSLKTFSSSVLASYAPSVSLPNDTQTQSQIIDLETSQMFVNGTTDVSVNINEQNFTIQSTETMYPIVSTPPLSGNSSISGHPAATVTPTETINMSSSTISVHGTSIISTVFAVSTAAQVNDTIYESVSRQSTIVESSTIYTTLGTWNVSSSQQPESSIDVNTTVASNTDTNVTDTAYTQQDILTSYPASASIDIHLFNSTTSFISPELSLSSTYEKSQIISSSQVLLSTTSAEYPAAVDITTESRYSEHTAINSINLETSESIVQPTVSTVQGSPTPALFSTTSDHVTRSQEEIASNVKGTLETEVYVSDYISYTTSRQTITSTVSPTLSHTFYQTPTHDTVRPSSQTVPSVVVDTPKFPTIENNSTSFYNISKHVSYRIVFTFDNDCDAFKGSEVLKEEFWKAFTDMVLNVTALESDNIEAGDMFCDPLRVFLWVQKSSNGNQTNSKSIFESLKREISTSSFNVPIIDGMHVQYYRATNVEIIEVITDGPEFAKTGLEVVDVVIIGVAAFLFAVLVIMMFIVICRECYVRKRTTTFHLSDIPHVNLKLSDFTLTKIPRPRMFYRDNSIRKPEPVPLRKIRQCQNGSSNAQEKVKVNADEINVRMSRHDDGIVVGITRSDPSAPVNDASSSSSSPRSVDLSQRFLLKEGSHGENCEGVINPTFTGDGDVQRNSKIIIQDDENEQLL